ncbi:hypothetical protein BTHE68_71300 (plasmid) [Burkholderia sp. THE68]|nr:hypothetical protein BTHE68_71300 [Burkholderia sp. THE68]
MPYTPHTQLYEGTSGQNLGYVSDHNQFLNGQTKPFGQTFDDFDAQQSPEDFIAVFAGVDTQNNREVSPNDHHKGGATRPIGYLSKKALVPGMFKIYYGTGASTNGIATVNPGFQRCNNGVLRLRVT